MVYNLARKAVSLIVSLIVYYTVFALLHPIYKVGPFCASHSFNHQSMHPTNTKDLALLAIIGVGTAVATYMLQHFARRYLYWNSKFIDAGKVEDLWLFPIKSCKGKQVPYLDCKVKGASFGENKDRYFLIVDILHNNIFLTARVYPRMVLIESDVQGGVLTLTRPDGNSVSVDLAQVLHDKHVRRAILHVQACTDGYDCGEQVGAFLTDFLEVVGSRDLRLLFFVDGMYTERDFASRSVYWNNPVPVIQDQIAYADLASYHAFTTASIDDLNSRLAEQNESISALNFRPNIVVGEASEAYDEDRWLHVRIGDQVEFVCYKPCTRCILTTVHPTQGYKNHKMEPLKELRSYRLSPPGKLLEEFKTSPIFGVNMALVKEGRIHVGDDVKVRYKPSPF